MACYGKIFATIFIVLNLKTFVEGAPQVPCYFIFGDSLLDNGNNNELNTTAKANYPPYGVDFQGGRPTGRFTNGRNTADFLAEYLGFDHYIPPFASVKDSEILEGVNYASGSAGIRNDSGSHLGDRIYLGRQLENHQTTISRIANLVGNTTSAQKHLNKCLFIVGIGSNDYINNYLMPEIYPSSHLYTPTQYATALIDQYSQHLRTLYEDGARKVALFGLGQIGCIPAELQKHDTRRCVSSTNNAIQQFNSKLKSLVGDLNTNFPDAKFTYINMYSISSIIGMIHLACLLVHAVTFWKRCLKDNVFLEKLHAFLEGFIFSMIIFIQQRLPIESRLAELIMLFYLLNLVEGAPEVPCYFIFGDSLLDNGNNNDLDTAARANYPPYGVDFPDGPTGRFTNGRNIADFLAEHLDFDHYIPSFASATGDEILEGVNYASGSAGIRNDTGSHLGYRIYLGKQLENHKVTISRIADLLGNATSAKNHLNKCLFIVGIGSNDYINNFLMPDVYQSSHLYSPSQYATLLIQQYSQQLKELYSDGARKIALFGLPQIGCIPDQLNQHSTIFCVDSTNKAVQLFNKNLKALVDDLNTNFPDAKFIYINMYSISSAIAITLLNNPCCQISKTMPEGQCIPGKSPCLFRATHFFYDNFHPTEIGNNIATSRAYRALLPSDSYPMDIRHLVRANNVYYDDQ
uniref:Uncharacterized protein n=1 Tax=Solanum lycopersicum TaxID=4081 RepID=A0A3Q7F2J4_SOLLC